MTARTPSVFVVGAGAVAACLAGALRRAGVPVLGLLGRRPEAVRQAGAIAGVATFLAAPAEVIRDADAVILAVSDDAVSAVAGELAGAGLLAARHVLLHCSGARSAAEALGVVAGRVGGTGTLHPLRAIADARAVPSLAGTLFGVEGEGAGKEMAARLVRLLGGRVLELRGEDMALYHAGASIASNFVVGIIDAAVEALAAAGVPRTDALSALAPLVASTVDNVVRLGPSGALTGPIARGDAGTVSRHLGALAAKAPEIVPLYCAVAARLVAIARERGELPAATLARLEETLAGPGKLP